MSTHRHKCDSCGHIWEHNHTCGGNEHAHTCPNPECRKLMDKRFGWPWYEGAREPHSAQFCVSEDAKPVPMPLAELREKAALEPQPMEDPIERLFAMVYGRQFRR